MKIWTVISNREEAITATLCLSEAQAKAERHGLIGEDWGRWCPNDEMASDTEKAFSELCSRAGYLDSYELEEHDISILPATGPYHGPALGDQLRLIGSLAGTADKRGHQDQRDAVAYVETVVAEMLAGLKAAEEWLTSWASAEPYLTRIQAAIAKAEGQANG
jgi:hypothetical protein